MADSWESRIRHKENGIGKVWELFGKWSIPDGAKTKTTDALGISGEMEIVRITAPNLDTDTIFQLHLNSVKMASFVYDVAIPDATTVSIHAIDLVSEGDKEAGKGIPVLADDTLTIECATNQTGAKEFQICIRGE